MKKQREDSIELYKKGGRDELSKAEEEEILLQGSIVPEEFEKRVMETNEKLKNLFLEGSMQTSEQ